MSEGDGSAVAWGSPFAGGDTSEVAQELAQDVEDTTGFSNSFSKRFFPRLRGRLSEPHGFRSAED